MVAVYLLYHQPGNLELYAGGIDVHSVFKDLCINVLSWPGTPMTSLMGRQETGPVKAVKLTKSLIRLVESIV
jgi:hypothetical protein